MCNLPWNRSGIVIQDWAFATVRWRINLSPGSSPTDVFLGPAPQKHWKRWRRVYCGYLCDSPRRTWGYWVATAAPNHRTYRGSLKAGPQCRRRRGPFCQNRIKWVCVHFLPKELTRKPRRRHGRGLTASAANRHAGNLLVSSNEPIKACLLRYWALSGSS